MAQVVAHLKATARELGLDFGDRKMTFNSRLAQEAGLWAQDQGRGHQFHDAAFRAYFVAGRNLARQEVLLDIVETAGLDVREGEQVIRERSFAPAVDRDWSLSRELGIAAAPTFIMGKERIVGARPYPALENLVKQNLGAPQAGHVGL